MFYVDQLTTYPESAIKPGARHLGNQWSHLTADTTEELLEVARKLGLQARWMQSADKPAYHHHFDVIPSVRRRAIDLGAIEVDTVQHMRERIARYQAAHD